VRLRTRPQSVDRLIVGLGNPGSQYARTRHNVGYLVLDELARRHGFSKPARAFSGRYAAGEIHGVGVGLLTPTTFMNDSGRSVAAAVRELKLGLAALLLVHDHIELLRVGVDRPPTTDPDIVADYVLSPFPESRAEVDELVRRAADAVEIWLRDDLETAMQTVNGVSGPSAPSAAGRPDR
jgi:PTH1 family peptidyl-tRNA hydrolase